MKKVTFSDNVTVVYYNKYDPIVTKVKNNSSHKNILKNNSKNEIKNNSKKYNKTNYSIYLLLLIILCIIIWYFI